MIIEEVFNLDEYKQASGFWILDDTTDVKIQILKYLINNSNINLNDIQELINFKFKNNNNKKWTCKINGEYYVK